jgi:hypothetical protein
LFKNLVIFDDIAAKVGSDFELNHLLNIINTRMDLGKSSIFTSNLGKKELTEIMEEGKDFPVECQFCDEQYLFASEDIKALLSQLEEA